jgi:formamidopyrimidine-DNA glycosylase
MPELPEVETIASGVHARVQGRRIVSVWTSGRPQTFKSPESEIVEALTGRTIASVRRVGKTIVMTVAPVLSQEAGSTPLARAPAPIEFLIHLGMTGRLLVSQAEVPLPPHIHATTGERSASSTRAVLDASASTTRRRRNLQLATCNLQLPTPAPAASRSPSRSMTLLLSFAAARRRSRRRC